MAKSLIKQVTELREENEGLKTDLADAEGQLTKADAAARLDAKIALKRIELDAKELTPYREFRAIEDPVERTAFWNANEEAIQEDQRRILAETQKEEGESCELPF